MEMRFPAVMKPSLALPSDRTVKVNLELAEGLSPSPHPLAKATTASTADSRIMVLMVR